MTDLRESQVLNNLWEQDRPFYTSLYDRFRLIELVFEKERKNAALTHDQLAARCNTRYLKPYHLTTLQNIARTLNDPRHQLDRGRILMALTWGLQLPKWKVDLVLMLFDGSPLSEEEWMRFMSPYARTDNVEGVAEDESSGADVRLSALRAIGELLGTLRPDGVPVSTRVTISDTHFDSLIARKEAVLEMETQPGMRLAVKGEPGSITDPPPESFADWTRWSEEREEPGPSAISEDDARRIHQLDLQRQCVCLEHVQQFGEAAIHSRPLLSRGLQQPGGGERLRSKLQRLTKLLWDYDSFHVALADTTPALEMKIIGFDRALMIGAGGSVFGLGSWPLAVYWNDPKTVLMFVSDFWENYYAIAPNNREKSSVIRQLCDLASLPHPRYG